MVSRRKGEGREGMTEEFPGGEVDFTRPITDQESFIRAHIEPMLESIFVMCKERNIPVLLQFEVRPNVVMSSAYLPDDTLALFKAIAMMGDPETSPTEKILMIEAISGIHRMMREARNNVRDDDDGE